MLKLFPPHLVFKVDRFSQPNTLARANGPVIRIRKDADFNQLYAHEFEHVKQWYFTLATHGIWYLVIKPYRQWAEVQAFKAEIKAGRDIADAASALANNYNLDITYEGAIKLLS